MFHLDGLRRARSGLHQDRASRGVPAARHGDGMRRSRHIFITPFLKNNLAASLDFQVLPVCGSIFGSNP